MKKSRNIMLSVLSVLTVLFFVITAKPVNSPVSAELASPGDRELIELVTAESKGVLDWGDGQENVVYSYDQTNGGALKFNCQPSAIVGMGQVTYGTAACDQTHLSFTANIPNFDKDTGLWSWNYVVFRGDGALDNFTALAFRKGGGHIMMLSRVAGTWYTYADSETGGIFGGISTVKNCELGSSSVLSGMSSSEIKMEIRSSSNYVEVYAGETAADTLIYQSALTLPLPSATGIFIYSNASSNSLLELKNISCKTFHDYGTWQEGTPAGVGTAGTVAHQDCSVCNKHFDSNNAEIENLVIPALNGIKYMSISASGDIGLNYYVYLGEYEGTPAATFSAGGETVGAADGAYDADSGCYVFTYGVAPKNYKETVTISVDGTEISGSYSVEKYAEQITADNAAYDIVQKVVAYCEAARVYFGGEQTTALDEITDDLSGYAAVISGSDEALTLKGATIVLNSKLSVNVYFTASDVDGVAFTVDGAAVTPEKVEGETDLYVLKVKNIVAKDINRTYTVALGGYTVRYSVLSYAQQALENGEDVALCNVLKTLYALSKSADAYFGE
ncbi:MAG: hypothetical protein ACI4SH_03925 [Candidatus Scatosoma sp.]